MLLRCIRVTRFGAPGLPYSWPQFSTPGWAGSGEKLGGLPRRSPTKQPSLLVLSLPTNNQAGRGSEPIPRSQHTKHTNKTPSFAGQYCPAGPSALALPFLPANSSSFAPTHPPTGFLQHVTGLARLMWQRSLPATTIYVDSVVRWPVPSQRKEPRVATFPGAKAAAATSFFRNSQIIFRRGKFSAKRILRLSPQPLSPRSRRGPGARPLPPLQTHVAPTPA